MNYAVGGDRNCGCIPAGSKCVIKQTANWRETRQGHADRSYGVATYRIERDHSRYV